MAVLCENCKKRTASIYFEKIINGTKTEYSLCSECAASLNPSLNQFSNFDNFLNDFVNIMMNTTNLGNQSNSSFSVAACKTCGLTPEEFSTHNKLGCSDCYNTFRPQLKTIFSNIQKSDKHIGKIPAKLGAGLIHQRKLSDLKMQLAQAVSREEYEQAAVLRDKIREISENNQQKEV